LAHDHVLLRQGLRRLLQDERDMEVVSEASNAAECLRKVSELQPDVLLADAGTFELPAREAELLVARESPNTRIIFLNMQEHGIAADSGFHAATGSCAVRGTSAQELVTMVRNSYAGAVMGEISASHLTAHYVAANHADADRLPLDHLQISASASLHQTAPPRRDLQRSHEAMFPQERRLAERGLSERALTAREWEVLKLLAEGQTVRGAATLLGVSNKTVDAHKFNLMRKLGIHNKAQLVMWAIQRKVVKVPANF
jgi:DNA-binding NarL/FixJ family response regulator